MYRFLLKEFKEKNSSKKLFHKLFENMVLGEKILFSIGLIIFILLLSATIFWFNKFTIFLSIIFILLACISYYLIIKFLLNVKYRIYDSHEKFYISTKVMTVKNILKNKNLYKKKKIEILINQIDEQIEDYNILKYLTNPIKIFLNSWLIPFLLIYLGWVFKIYGNEDIKSIIGKIFLTSLILLLFYFATKPILDDLINKDIKKMKQLKIILQDILILD